ncbi:hypothetical protein E3Q17_00714 [Wallemia mellicola]|uniref:ARM repeat-containing protein n=1 Tax=Wallemia mellicola TaxID=1708541 RepID=A0A4T0S3A7_9BASI|nr:hypothetical protein E3Q24_00225 [Wallemia mellicola]TIC03998.1 hypothetical protein E3Q17_00714 [Wallemia mellicola]TIC14504.1 hypothetical protein E3Q14_00798 [Wallemia mellicola]TIC45729.1 hypothetical protein E3Q08_01067 [Wallemia mellicola]TIC75989.1 hypothetical protein E3Q00_00328 [Wallemia mellicola]
MKSKLAEYLVMLMNADLYDSYIDSQGVYNMENALYSAISLIERCTTIEESRIGYLYLTLHAPRVGEWNVMLVNTLKKDLESESDARILLAVTFLIHKPFMEVIPAVNLTLLQLLSHNRRFVRLRVANAISQLIAISDDGGLFDSDALMKFVKEDTSECLQNIKLDLMDKKYQNNDSTFHDVDIQQLETLIEGSEDVILRRPVYVLKILRNISVNATTLGNTSISNILVKLLRQVRETSSPYKHAIGLEILKHAREIPTEVRSYIENLINNKTANTPNYRYAILAQLLVIPGDVANKILGEKESLYVMDTLENQDVTLRKKALQLLGHIDMNTLKQYHQMLLQVGSQLASECEEYLR